MSNTTKPLTGRQKQAKRRAAIAKAIKAKKTVPEVCAKFSVSPHTVRSACIEHGVPVSLSAAPSAA